MARIFRDSGVLNQFGSPSLNSNTFANRPAFGQRGRLFVDTTNNVIYRDTGTSWALITGGASSIPNLQQVTTVGNTTTNNILVTARENLFTKTFDTNDIGGDTTNILNIGSNVNLSNAVAGLYNIFSESYKTITQNITLADGSDWQNIGIFNSYSNQSLSSKTITLSQGYPYINALSSLGIRNSFDSISNLNISHFASIIIKPLTINNGTITNYYGLLINDSTSSTITNRWGIYQSGANDINYFAGEVRGNRFIVNTTIASAGYVESVNYKPQGSNNFNFLGTDYVTVLGTIFNSTSNWRIGSGTDSGRKLQVNGNIEVITTTATGIHTATAQHLPIYVNGTLYYLQLLN
jgi:hypothetical protein